MPQISLYIDKETLLKIEAAAESEQLSISKWVGTQLKKSLNANYSSDFLGLYGSVTDDTFREPEDRSFDSDSYRETF